MDRVRETIPRLPLCPEHHCRGRSEAHHGAIHPETPARQVSVSNSQPDPTFQINPDPSVYPGSKFFHPGFRIQIFFHPRSALKKISILTQKIVTKLSEI
jgi:hypothetical protein